MEPTKSHTPLAVYTITEREKDGKKFWVRLGTAFRNRDGSLNATLDGMPTNGTLHIRELRANDAPREGGRSEDRSAPPREARPGGAPRARGQGYSESDFG